MKTRTARTTIALALGAVFAGCTSVPTVPPVSTAPLERVRHSAGDAEGQYALGKYYLGQQRAALALVAFTKAIAHDASHVEARNGRATALAQLGDLDAAARELDAAIALKPDASHLHGNLGYIRMQAGDHAAAAAALRRAFELDPKNARVRANWEALVARASANPAVAAGLEATGRGADAGLAAPQKAPAITRESAREVVSQSVVNLAYGPAPVHAAAGPGSSSASVITIPPPAAASAPSGAITVTRFGTGRDALAPEMPSTAMRQAPAEPARPVPDATKAAVIEQPKPPALPSPKTRVAVSNGNGAPGMARRFGERFRAEGVRVVSITNARSFKVEQSRIHFRDGRMDDAIALARRLGNRPAILLDNSIGEHVDLRLVLGRDATPNGALAREIERTEQLLADARKVLGER